ncbi:PACE efflux transporter [Acetobacter aceti]|uniref:Membrane protein n=1 Tax=Acetobacter aceti TaxID=435 RepID=A0A6S6PJK5_ACEAC|nr:PACE efflux transporter [Acetobacter aceti]BCI66885.1 membrane protein [Acetobacter aceti]
MSTESTQSSPAMRSGADRLRHMVLFECLALAIVIPCGSMLFGVQGSDMSAIGVGCAITASLWNYGYNLFFDRIMRHLTGSTRKSIRVRLLHTLLFEIGLQLVLLPAIALYLGISLMQAFSLNMAIALFYLAYTFLFNIAYDSIFPAGGVAAKSSPTVTAE